MKSASHDPEMALFEMELAALELARVAMEAWQNMAEDAVVPPTNVLRAVEQAHGMILRRLEKRIGFSFDVNDLEGALVAVEKQREVILQLKARRDQQAGLLQ
jgi:ribosomal protein L13E